MAERASSKFLNEVASVCACGNSEVQALVISANSNEQPSRFMVRHDSTAHAARSVRYRTELAFVTG